jgi:phage regulator Rha-like protein
MKNARKTPKSQASAVEQRKDTATLVTVEHGRPVTTTDRVAAAAGLQHASVIKLVREHLADFEEFGRVRFQIAPFATAGGEQSREVAELNEPQAALLFLYQRNVPKVRAVKVRLVKEFFRVTAELNRLKTQRTAPEWQAARLETRHDFRNVSDMLQEVRADAGKATKPHIFINESKLLRFALTGSESAKWERDNLSRDDLRLLGKVERLDMRLIAREVPFHDRKAACRTLVMQERGLLLKGVQP